MNRVVLKNDSSLFMANIEMALQKKRAGILSITWVGRYWKYDKEGAAHSPSASP